MSTFGELLQPYKEYGIKGEFPTLIEFFKHAVSLYPEKNGFTAFGQKKESYTFTEAYAEIQSIGNYLYSQGIRKGDVVAVSGKNSPQWIFSFYGVLSIGAVPSPMDPQLPLERLVSMCGFAEIQGIICDREMGETLFAQAPASCGVKLSLEEAESDAQSDIPWVLNLPECEPHSSEGPEENDLAALMFTSGTTGQEKAVMLTHKNITSDIIMAGQGGFIGASERDNFYMILPAHHIYTLTVCVGVPVYFGAGLVIGKRLVLPEIQRDLRKGDVTVFIGIPLLFNKILKGLMKQVREKGMVTHLLVGTLMRLSGLWKKITKSNGLGKFFFKNMIQKKVGMDGVRVMICGGGPLSPETVQRYNELGFQFVQGYGLTETAPILNLNPIKSCRYGSVGKAFPQLDMKIINKDSRGNGEVVLKGPNTTLGYYKNQEATDALFTDDGYLRTGDVGHMDKDGFLYLTGRSKSLIVTEGGKNVFPEEIEEHFQLIRAAEQVLIKGYQPEHSDVHSEHIEAVIFPSKDHYGESVTEEAIQQDLVEIIKKINTKLLPYQRISRLTILDGEMETTNTKKIKRGPVIERLEKSPLTSLPIK